MIEYWLYTEEYPESEIQDRTWGIATLKTIHEENGVDNGEVKSVIYDTTGYLKPGFTSDLYDDAITEDPQRVLRFLFAQEFWK